MAETPQFGAVTPAGVPDATVAPPEPAAATPDLAAMRVRYTSERLHESDAGDDPFALFRRWLGAAVAVGLPEPNAMVLATVGPIERAEPDCPGTPKRSGTPDRPVTPDRSVTRTAVQPSARHVLLKELDARGFVFYTNRASRKGCQLAVVDRAALCFPWFPMSRQVSVEGAVERVDDESADAYFAVRPRESQIGAWASTQSAPLPDRAALDRAAAAAVERFGDGPIPRPPTWGGYRLVPERIEFWQGAPGRLHDRLEYRRLFDADSGTDERAVVRWERRRLSP